MNNSSLKNTRILAIAPSTAGFGFAVLEGKETLVDWGVKRAEGDKNRQCLLKVKGLIADYQPSLIVLENFSGKDSHRRRRTRSLTKQIIALASSCKVKAKLFSREQISKTFFPDGQGTKHALAEIIAQRFPEELMHQIPPKRGIGDGESSRMAIFEAVALAIILVHPKR